MDWSVDDIDRLVHEPAHYRMLSVLYVVERGDFLFIKNQTGLTKGNLSSHMTKLEDAGYVRAKKEFVGRKPHTMLSMTKKGRKAFEHYWKLMAGVIGKE